MYGAVPGSSLKRFATTIHYPYVIYSIYYKTTSIRPTTCKNTWQCKQLEMKKGKHATYTKAAETDPPRCQTERGHVTGFIHLFMAVWRRDYVSLRYSGGFLSSFARIWGECSDIHSPPALCLFLSCFIFVVVVCLVFFFFFWGGVEISSRTLIPLFMPASIHSGSASWDHCGRMFSDKLRVSSFPKRFPHYAWTAA